MMSERDAAKGKVLLSTCAVIISEDDEVLLMREGDTPYHDMLVLPGGMSSQLKQWSKP